MMTSAEVLAVAGRAFDWVGRQAVDAPGGATWCEVGAPTDDLYAGTAGVLLACAEARAAGLDVDRVAARARGRLLHLAYHPQDAQLPDDSCFSGWSGVALALIAWSRAAGDAQAGQAAGAVTAAIADRLCQADPAPDRYLDVISGDAGMLLVLLESPGLSARQAAELLADRLVAATERTQVGLQWPMHAGYPFLMPGFSHGTAGVAFALLRAGRYLGRPDLVRLAVTAAEALAALGTTPGGWALPLTCPDYPNRPPVNYGWCHGVAGTVQLFAQLELVDPRWHAVVDACLTALHGSGVPQRVYPGFWDNLARCCGTAGVGRVLLRRYDVTGQRELLEWAGRLAADVLDRRIEDAGTTTWSNTEYKRTPPDLPPEPGFMQGTAGIAAWLTGLSARMAAAAGDAPGSRPVPLGAEWF